MRASFHAELDELMTELARMARLAGQMMTNASIALHQTDLALAGVVIADSDQMDGMLDDMERRCIIVLALQAPVAGDLRVVVAALHAVGHLVRGWAASPGISPSLPVSSIRTRWSPGRSVRCWPG